MRDGIGRRSALLILAGLPASTLQGPRRTPTAGSGETGRLFNPGAAGRPRAPTTRGDASAEIQAVERKLACHCGCTLDIFTCRTTDFTCTTSPRLHQEVVALHDGGATAREILDVFKVKYGEQALMAPEPEGFNLAGYLVPGILIVLLGTMLAWLIVRRLRLAESDLPLPAAAAGVTAEAEDRLRRALQEVED